MKLVSDPNVIFIEVREGEELQETGKLKDVLQVPRGLLEFQADPNNPSHTPALGSAKKLVVYCVSGNRSALGAKSLKKMESRAQRMSLAAAHYDIVVEHGTPLGVVLIVAGILQLPVNGDRKRSSRNEIVNRISS